ncbi:phosphotransferase enzyme family protein [Micromonospora sediminicola]|uniref:phosphotransferase enzyme family protein n=1 Tax=Micromonospora sediminicola TaxID=946078 RepID=UPI0037AB50F8
MPVPSQRIPDERRDLQEACRAVGLDPREARHVRTHSNEIWLLPRPALVVRLSMDHHDVSAATRMVRLVRWLCEQDLPVAEPWPGSSAPLVLSGGRIATYWRGLTVPEAPDYRAFGSLMRRLHDVAPPPGLSLPELDPVAAAAEILDEEWPDCGLDRRFVADRLAELGAQLRSAPLPLSRGLVHGDAHVGNLLVDRGRLVMGDWDSACVGTPAWDLIPTALEPQRWARPRTSYRAFVEGYGQDVTTWPYYRELRELVEWRRITERIRVAGRVPRAGRNLCRHLHTMYADDLDTPWYGPEAEAAARGPQTFSIRRASSPPAPSTSAPHSSPPHS